jgi:alcohol dehydrogenase (cytochrome c)
VCELFFKSKQEFHEGQWYQASTDASIPNEPATGAVVAVDPANGETRWRFEMVTPTSGGMLTTGGGLVFTGDGQGYLMALDARTGKPLWHFQTGGHIIAPPVTYTFNGKQQITIAAGSSIMTFALVN